MYGIGAVRFCKSTDPLFGRCSENTASLMIGVVSADFGSSACKKFEHFSTAFFPKFYNGILS
jgi:hypothetical protein